MAEIAVSDIKCTQCALYETSIVKSTHRSGVYGRGSGKSGLWIYGDVLDGIGCELGLPMVGDAGTILSKILQEINLPEDEIFITNTVRCKLPNNRNPKVKEIKMCMDTHAQLDIPKTPPKLVMCLGKIPLKAILGKQKVKDNRGVIFDCELFNCKAMASYHPASIMFDKKGTKYETLKADLLKAKEYIYELREKPQVRHKILLNSKASFLEWMKIFSDPSTTERTCDIETTGLFHWKDDIISISFTTEIDGEIISIAFLTVEKPDWWFADLHDPEIRVALQEVLNFPIDFHGGLFDTKFFWKEGFYVKPGIDTMDAHLMVDESAPHNLQYCSSIYNKDSGNDGYKQEIDTLLGEEGQHKDLPPLTLLDYNANDTYETYLLKKRFLPVIKNEKLDDFFYRLAVPLKNSLTRMSYRGIMMDRQGIMDTSERYRKEIREKRIELWDLAGKEFDYSGTSKTLKTVLFNDLGLPITKRTEKSGMPSTDKYVMKELARISPVPAKILELRAYEYALNMYLDGDSLNPKGVKPGAGMLCHLDDKDRIHGPFLSGGTISGRPSCPKPNLLNIPKNPDIRNLFIAPPGWKLIEADYSQAELVLLAHLSGDEQFIKDVGSDDFHEATAKSLMKLDVVDKNSRAKAKAINFLKSYGGGAEKLGLNLKALDEERYFTEFQIVDKHKKVCLNQRAWWHTRSTNCIPLKYETIDQYREKCYVCEADEWLKKSDMTYAKVPAYKEQQHQLWKSQGYLIGLYGRKKRFPNVFNKKQISYCDRISVNFPCQNAVSETVNRSIIDINSMLDMVFGWNANPSFMYGIPGIVLGVYDSIICEAPDDLVPDIKELMYQMMSLPLPQINVPLKIDFTISQQWGAALEKPKSIVELDDDEEINELEILEIKE